MLSGPTFMSSGSRRGPDARHDLPTTDHDSEIAFLTRALKAPTLRESVARLAERVRTESWSYEEFLAACLQREVSTREAPAARGFGFKCR